MLLDTGERYGSQHTKAVPEQSLAVSRDLALADVSGEYEEAMKTFPVR